MLCCGAGGSSDNKVHDFTPEGSPSKKYEETPHPLDKSRASATNVYASMLTRGQEQEIQKVFARFDRDGNGTIEAKELEVIMNQMGSKPTAEQIADMIQAADADASGTIDYDEFLTMMAKRLIVANGKEELEMAFRRAPGPRAHAVAMPRGGGRAAPALRIPSPALPPSRAQALRPRRQRRPLARGDPRPDDVGGRLADVARGGRGAPTARRPAEHRHDLEGEIHGAPVLEGARYVGAARLGRAALGGRRASWV